MISEDDENHEFNEIVGSEYKEPAEWVLIRDYTNGNYHVKIVRSTSVPEDAVYSGLTENKTKQYFTSAHLTQTKNWIKYV